MSLSLPITPSARVSGPYTAGAGQTAFSVTFPFQDNADLRVETRASDYDAWTAAVLGTDYSVTGAGTPGGGAVIFGTGRAAGTRVRITGRAAIAALLDAVPAGSFDSKTFNTLFDRVTIWTQELRRDTDSVTARMDVATPQIAGLLEDVAGLTAGYVQDFPRAGITGRKIPTATVRVNGYNVAGDYGYGAVYVAGASDGPQAIQDTDGLWRQLWLNHGDVEAGWFGGIPGDLAKTNAAVTAAETALAAAGGGTLTFPGTGWRVSQVVPHAKAPRIWTGYVDTSLISQEFPNLYAMSGETYKLDGPHADRRLAAKSLDVYVVGAAAASGGKGDNAFEINLQKLNWRNTTANGEMAGLVVNARQGGDNTGRSNDLSGIGIDVGTVTGAGFTCQYENVTTQFGPVGDGTPVVYRMGQQCGVINSRTGTRIGYVHNAIVGTMETAMYFQTESTARWGDILRSQVAALGAFICFSASDVGKLTWNPVNDAAKTMSVEVNSAGTMAWRRGNGTTDLLATLDQVGVFAIKDSLGIGIDGFGDRNAYIDFNAADGYDYNSRLIRGAGVNGSLDLIQLGTGTLRIRHLGSGQSHWTGSGGYIHNVTGNIQFGLFSEADTGATWYGSNVFQGSDTGSHNGQGHFNTAIRHRPVGSGTNGPSHADYGLGISLIKQNWGTTTVGGELDGAYFVVRQGGPDVANNAATNSSDCSCWLADIQNVGASGFAAVFEAAASNVDRSFAMTKAVRIQAGVINTTLAGQQSYGYLAIADTGVHDAGFQVQNGTASSWAAYFKGVGGTGNTLRFQITDTNYVFNLDGWITNNTADLAKVSNNFWQAYTSSRVQNGSYTIDFDQDLGRTVHLAGGAATTVTLPNTGKVGWWCDLVLDASAAVATFSPASGASLLAKSSHTKLSTLNGRVRLEVSANPGGASAVYTLSGDTST